MLALRRREGESVVLDGGIRVKVLRFQQDGVLLGFEAPKHVRVLREEIVVPYTKEKAGEQQ